MSCSPLLADCAERAERLRQRGAKVVLLTGSELSLFTLGLLPDGALGVQSVARDRPDLATFTGVRMFDFPTNT